MAQERPPIEEMTLRQLRKVASELKISKYSRMRKAQLKSAIKEKQNFEKQNFKKTAVNQSIELNQSSLPIQEEQKVEATKFEVGQESSVDDAFSDLDRDLGELPSGYGESRIVVMPRDPQWAYCYWDVANESKEELRRQGGQQLALRIYDTTDIDINSESPHSVQEYLCDEMTREWYLPVPVSDRNYVVDIGYRCNDGRLSLIHI